MGEGGSAPLGDEESRDEPSCVERYPRSQWHLGQIHGLAQAKGRYTQRQGKYRRREETALPPLNPYLDEDLRKNVGVEY
jgi:hypothetical protein